MPERERIEGLARRFGPGRIGSEIRYLDKVDSTNRLALELPAAEAPHGLTLVAREQTAGRGRQGRSWLSLPDAGLHFTAVLRPDWSGSTVPMLTFAGALAVHEALRRLCRAPLDIRWPNDVMLDGGKVSGVLGEAAYLGDRIERVALGISVNVGHGPGDFPPGMTTTPTSILMAEGSAPTLDELLGLVLEGLNTRYDSLAAGDHEAVLDQLRRNSRYTAGRRLLIWADGEATEVTSAGLNDDGSLQVRLPSGVETTLRAGEVRIIE